MTKICRFASDAFAAGLDHLYSCYKHHERNERYGAQNQSAVSQVLPHAVAILCRNLQPFVCMQASRLNVHRSVIGIELLQPANGSDRGPDRRFCGGRGGSSCHLWPAQERQGTVDLARDQTRPTVRPADPNNSIHLNCCNVMCAQASETATRTPVQMAI